MATTNKIPLNVYKDAVEVLLQMKTLNRMMLEALVERTQLKTLLKWNVCSGLMTLLMLKLHEEQDNPYAFDEATIIVDIILQEWQLR